MPNPNSGILDLSPVPTLPGGDIGWQRTAGPASRLCNAIRELMTRFLVWRAQQATLRLLRSLDAATLRDLGIIDVDSAVYGNPQDRVRPYDPEWWRSKPC